LWSRSPSALPTDPTWNRQRAGKLRTSFLNAPALSGKHNVPQRGGFWG